MDLEKGGRGTIERMVEAYGFSTRQALYDQLGVSKGTLANRYMRDSFPSDWVIQCSLETGASLKWLINGQGKMFGEKSTDLIEVGKIKIIEGHIFESGSYFFDRTFLKHNFIQPLSISDDKSLYVSEQKHDLISDGKWLVNIDDSYSIRDISKLPGNKIRVSSNLISFDCGQNDLTFHSKIIITVNW